MQSVGNISGTTYTPMVNNRSDTIELEESGPQADEVVNNVALEAIEESELSQLTRLLNQSLITLKESRSIKPIKVDKSFTRLMLPLIFPGMFAVFNGVIVVILKSFILSKDSCVSRDIYNTTEQFVIKKCASPDLCLEYFKGNNPDHIWWNMTNFPLEFRKADLNARFVNSEGSLYRTPYNFSMTNYNGIMGFTPLTLPPPVNFENHPLGVLTLSLGFLWVLVYLGSIPTYAAGKLLERRFFVNTAEKDTLETLLRAIKKEKNKTEEGAGEHSNEIPPELKELKGRAKKVLRQDKICPKIIPIIQIVGAMIPFIPLGFYTIGGIPAWSQPSNVTDYVYGNQPYGYKYDGIDAQVILRGVRDGVELNVNTTLFMPELYNVTVLTIGNHPHSTINKADITVAMVIYFLPLLLFRIVFASIPTRIIPLPWERRN